MGQIVYIEEVKALSALIFISFLLFYYCLYFFTFVYISISLRQLIHIRNVNNIVNYLKEKNLSAFSFDHYNCNTYHCYYYNFHYQYCYQCHHDIIVFVLLKSLFGYSFGFWVVVSNVFSSRQLYILILKFFSWDCVII